MFSNVNLKELCGNLIVKQLLHMLNFAFNYCNHVLVDLSVILIGNILGLVLEHVTIELVAYFGVLTNISYLLFTDLRICFGRTRKIIC